MNIGNDVPYYNEDGTPKKLLPETQMTHASLLCNYIYLDREERILLAKKKHNILINQLQINKHNLIHGNTNIDLSFNHPVYCLLWTMQLTKIRKKNEIFNYSTTSHLDDELVIDDDVYLFKNAKISMNGKDRLNWRDAHYFNLVQNYETFHNFADM